MTVSPILVFRPCFENIGDPKRYDRGKTTFDSGFASPFVKYAVYAFEAIFKNIEIELSDGKDWLVEGKYSLADLGLTPYLARLEYLNLLEVWLSSKKYTQSWWERIKTRPSFKKAI